VVRLLPFQDSELGAVSDEKKTFLVAPKNRGKLNCEYVLDKKLCKETISGAFLNTGKKCIAPLTNEQYRAMKYEVVRKFTTAIPEKTDDAPVMFMASNPTKCHQNCDKNNRMGYVEALMKHTKVDSYGLVLHNKDSVNVGGETLTMSGRKHGNWERPVVIKILSAYKFYLAFENSNCEDYLTEKFWRPLLAGSVPIVMGGCDYSKFAPSKDSYLHVKDFKSAEELAEYVNKADKEPELYKKHLAWRTMRPEQWSAGFQQVLGAPKPECELCKLLHTKDFHRQTGNLNEGYWSKSTNCATDGWHAGEGQIST